MTDIERAETTQQTAPATPTVWILSTGVIQEPGHILGIYTERDLAIGDLITNAYELTTNFPIVDSGQHPDGTLHLSAGSEWLSLEPYTVTTRHSLGT